MESTQTATIGIDLGGTSTRIGLYDKDLSLVDSRSMVTRVAAGAQACVEEMAEAVQSLLDGAHGFAAADILGVGIGSPGPINLRTGVLGHLPNFPGWDDFPLRDSLAKATGLPVILESDANAAAIAEWKLGAGKSTGLNSMAMLTLGTGVGTGLILDGKVWHGMFGMGGEVGHSTLDPEGPLCGCGSHGCLEVFASANGLVRLATQAAEADSGTVALRALVADPENFTTRAVADLANEGDSAARQAFERLGFYLGLGVASIINTLDVPMIVIGGGVAGAWMLFA
ncbi:MAG TPA: ROK family protein, partial [Acidobacteriaceae bacterium]